MRLEIFLRSINWFDPLQVNIAHNYLKKWKRIDPEDAISLLDARFPDTHVRNYAISILRDMTDDLMNLYMAQMCQCLIYESQLINPLSDFLIEKSIQSPMSVGVIFYWNATVSMKHPLFKQRLQIFLAYIFAFNGYNFFFQIFKSNQFYVECKNTGEDAKKLFNTTPGSNETKKNIAKKFVQTNLREMKIKDVPVRDFYFPIHNSYFGREIDSESSSVFGSKMVPIKISAKSSDGSNINVIFKSGDDLRQDVLTLQILKVMDKMWLDNDLDLKITAYKVLPTGISDGFIQFVSAECIDALQMDQGFAGALDRELLMKYLRKTSENGTKYDIQKQQENFVKSLAGFCVATCVMGIGDRHLGNVMLKDNGILFHIDYGHFLGNFKTKFGYKRETAPFVLVTQFVAVFGGEESEEFKQFENLCIEAFNVLRANFTLLCSLFTLMISSGLPELRGYDDLKWLYEKLCPEKSDEQAAEIMRELIQESLRNERTRANLFAHLKKHYK